MKMLAITLISSIVFSGISEGGVSYGRGGPNQYARIVVVDLSIAIENLKPTLEQGKLSGEDLIRTKKMIDDACAGKCSETAIQNLITTQEDKEKLEVIHKEIYEQLVRMLQLARDHNPSKDRKSTRLNSSH